MIGGVYHRGGGYLTKREAAEAENCLSPNRRMAFGELADKYLTWVTARNQSAAWVYEKKLFVKKHLSKWFRIPADEITRIQIEEHLLERAEAVSSATGNKDLKFIRAIFSYGIQVGYIASDPTRGIKRFPVDEKIKYVPPMTDFIRLCDVAAPQDRKLLVLLFCTGGRINELLSMRWEDLRDGFVVLRSRKHKDGAMKERRIPMNDVMKAVIEEDTAGRSDYVFENRREMDRYLRRPKLMRGLCKKAGVPFFGFHNIRHLATSVLMQEGESIQVLKDLLGHAKITTTQIYLHSLENSLENAAQKLGKIFVNHSLKSDEYSIKIPKKSLNEAGREKTIEAKVHGIKGNSEGRA